ncbi:MAG: 3-hydroxyacyl-CoA dehydrogenase/enoyl-CoA hydratase family protein [Calditrichaeota bacterium]|nr:MAG: 3-hydroxyacyl-CoA dehydrogenase/enoyl-CoA hydratase family protein [Calditrichota bacterium]
MKKEIKKVAVLGTGVMGSQIAAHLANAGIPSLAFDISQEVAQKGIEMATKIKPAAFYNPKSVQLITPCNFDEHLQLLSEVDWVIEAVVERLDIKRSLFEKIIPHLSPDTIISSNTSGISLKDMTEGMPESFRKHFLVTHFFNPPRYMHLLEIVSTPDTLPEVVDTMVTFCENVLGKGIVYAKDTPNFIANRIGVFGMMVTLDVARKMRLTVEEVDALTGPVIGRPKSATFRTADVVGLDTLAHVASTAYENCPDDEQREMFKLPDFLKKMLENKWLGQKSGQGFYKKEGKEILSLNLETLEYQPRNKPKFDALRIAKRYHTPGGKIRSLVFNPDKGGKFVWEILSSTLIYAANRIPEIADDVVNVDNALRWGFGWDLGPFEIWDAIGVPKSLERMKEEGKKIPAWVMEMVENGIHSFYQVRDGVKYFYDPGSKAYKPVETRPRVIHLQLEKSKERVIKENWSASLIDLGDGILCAEFHSVAQPDFNPLDAAMFDILEYALEYIPEQGYKGLIIANQQKNFSAGANLAMILEACQQKEWSKVEQMSKQFQDIGQQLKYSSFPVVSAPFNMCLGGGFEIAGAANRIVASAELYVGLVEVGVGLIPGGGGTLRVLLNFLDKMARIRSGPFPPVQKAFETIGYAKVSSSAAEAIPLGYLTKEDRIVINPDHLIYEAKQTALEMAKDYQPPEPRNEIYLPGEGGRLAIEGSLEAMHKQGVLSDHDLLIGKKLAYVLTGGDKANHVTPVDEQYLLDLERQAFVELCQEKKTQERMEYMLKTGKPLRN